MDKILVIGGGKLVYFLTRVLLAKGSRVTIINEDTSECTHLARALKATVVHGNGSDPSVLDEAGAVAYHLAMSPGRDVRRFAIASVFCPFRRAHGATVPWVRVEESVADTVLFRVQVGSGSDSIRCVFPGRAGARSGPLSPAALEVVREVSGAGTLRFRVGGSVAGG